MCKSSQGSDFAFLGCHEDEKSHVATWGETTVICKRTWNHAIQSMYILNLQRLRLLSLPESWCVSECLTPADLCPSGFTPLILTLRMTAPANCTSACPLTQRSGPPVITSQICLGLQSISLLTLPLLCHLMTAAFPAHFTRDSRVTQGDLHVSAVTPHPISEPCFWLSSVASEKGRADDTASL